MALNRAKLDSLFRSDVDSYGPTVYGPNGMLDKNPYGDQEFVDKITGGGGKSRFFQSLREAGIPPSQYGYYMEKAGITNLNSENDMRQIIAAYNADERFQGAPASDSTEAPAAEEPVIRKSPDTDPVKEIAAADLSDTFKRKQEFEASQQGDDEEPNKYRDIMGERNARSDFLNPNRDSYIDDAYDFKKDYTFKVLDNIRRV